MNLNIKQLMEEYAKLCKLIKAKQKALRQKHIEFRETLDKKYNSPENELKKAIFNKKIQPDVQKLQKLKNQQRAMEVKYSFNIPLKDLYEELAITTKKNGNQLILDVEDIDYVWTTKSRDINPTILEKLLRTDSFSGYFDVTMYNKSAAFYFRKRMGFSKYLKFSDNGTIKNNVYIDYSSTPFKIRFKDPSKLLIPFSLTDLFYKSDTYDIKKVQKAVVKCYEKLHPVM